MSRIPAYADDEAWGDDEWRTPSEFEPPDPWKHDSRVIRDVQKGRGRRRRSRRKAAEGGWGSYPRL